MPSRSCGVSDPASRINRGLWPHTTLGETVGDPGKSSWERKCFGTRTVPKPIYGNHRFLSVFICGYVFSAL